MIFKNFGLPAYLGSKSGR